MVATVTLIPDSTLGLPMDKIFKDEVDTLRKNNRYVSEVSQLAIDASLFPKGWFAMFNFSKLIFVFKLFKFLLDYALSIEKLNNLCIAINPRQKYLYKFLCFDEFKGSQLKHYGSVNKAPAIAKSLDLDTLKEKLKKRKGLYKIFFEEKTNPKEFENKFKLTVKDIKYFFVEKSDIFKKATKKQLEYVKRCYYGDQVNMLMKNLNEKQKKT